MRLANLMYPEILSTGDSVLLRAFSSSTMDEFCCNENMDSDIHYGILIIISVAKVRTHVFLSRCFKISNTF